MKNKSSSTNAGSSRRLSMAVVLGGSVVFSMTCAAQDTATWNGSASGDWSNSANWDGSFVPNGNDAINIGGSSNTTMNNDLTGGALNQYRLLFSTGAGAFTLNGNAMAFYDFGGNAPKIENNSSNLQTIQFGVTMDGAGTGGGAEINPVTGDLYFGSSVTLADTTVLNIWGGNNKTVTFNSGINAATFGQLVLNQKSTTVLNGTSSFGGENNLTNSNGNITIGTNPTDTGASLTLNGTVNGVDNIRLLKGTLNINSGATLNAVRFVTSDDSGAVNTINQAGGTFNVSGNVNSGTSSSFFLGHWAAASTYNLSGGTLNAPNAPLNLGWDGQATVNQTGGTANLQGINFNNGRTNTALYDVATGGRLNIGSYGMNGNVAAKTMRLSGGTLGAYADWTGTQDINLSTTSVVNTLDSADNTTARTITLNSVVSGAGGLTKQGAGVLVMGGGDDTYSGATVVNGGTLRITSPVRSSTSFTANSGATLELNGTNLFVGGHGTALADSKTLNANGGTLLMTASFDARIGNVNLSNGATWTSNRVLTAWDAYIAPTSSGATPTITVANTGGNTNPSVMGGTDVTGLHLGGVTNFNVSDVTASGTADLTVTMRLDNGGSGGGTGSVVKLGGGTMLLNGQMSYTGGTTVNAGILAVDGNQQANRLTANHAVTVNNTGVFEIRGVNSLPSGTNSVDVTVNAGGALNVVSGGSAAIGATGQSHAHIRNLALNGGTVNLGYSGGGSAYSGESFVLNGQVTVGGSAASTIQYSTGGNAGNSGFALNGTKTFSVADATTSTAADLLVTAEIEDGDSASGMVKSGGGTMALSATNTYSGGTTINGGTLDLTGGGGVSGTIRGTVTVNTGATLRLSANDATGYSTGSDSLKTINLTGGTMHVATNGGTGQNQTLGNAAINLTGGAITGVAGSNIDFFQGSSSINTLASAAESTISGAQLKIRQTGGLTITTAEGAAARDLVVNSVIASDGGFTTAPLIKAGDGTLVMTGANTYTGATSVSAGTLMVIGALGDTAVTVGAGGTLSGTGTLGGSLTFDAGAKLDLTGSTLGLNSSDVLTVATGKAITLTDFTFGSILGWTAASADQGTYELIKGGGTVTFNGSTPTVSNMFDFGNGKLGYFEQGSLRAVIVPEPSIVLLGGLGALGLLRRRRNS